jgi:hypothetical protein
VGLSGAPKAVPAPKAWSFWSSQGTWLRCIERLDGCTPELFGGAKPELLLRSQTGTRGSVRQSVQRNAKLHDVIQVGPAER